MEELHRSASLVNSSIIQPTETVLTSSQSGIRTSSVLLTSSQSVGNSSVLLTSSISSSTIQSEQFFIDETLLASSQPIETVLTSSQPTVTSSVLPIISFSNSQPIETVLTGSQPTVTSSVLPIISFSRSQPIETVLTSSQPTGTSSVLPIISFSSSQPIETVLTSSQPTVTSSVLPIISFSSSQPIETVLTSSQPTVTSSVLPIISSSSSQPIETVLTGSQPTGTSSVPFISSSTIELKLSLETLIISSQPIMTSSVLLTSSLLLNGSPPPIESSSVPFTSSPTIQPTRTSSLLLITSTYRPMETESEVIQLVSTGIYSALVEPVKTSIELKTSSSAYQSLEISSELVSIPSSSVIPHETNVAPELCGSGGGWTRLAYLNMSDATQNCPSGFRLYQSGGVRACGRPATNSGSCVSVQFPSNGISYSQICGRVTGYQFGHIDGFDGSYSIDTNYVEGVSITHGSPRQHVWTLSAGYSEASSAFNACPCNTGSTVSVPSFIGNNYFCESGNPNSGHSSNTLHTSDPLWDGQGCGSLESPCCNVPGIPWFHRDYGNTTTTDYIELRVCASVSSSSGEDAPVSYYEIYVK